MRLSARNIIKGKILEVKRGATTAHVKIDVGGGTVITSHHQRSRRRARPQGGRPGLRGDQGLRRHGGQGLSTALCTFSYDGGDITRIGKEYGRSTVSSWRSEKVAMERAGRHREALGNLLDDDSGTLALDQSRIEIEPPVRGARREDDAGAALGQERLQAHTKGVVKHHDTES